MPETVTIDRDKWSGFFDTLSADFNGSSVAIELVGAEYGDQYETERLPFTYASYDYRDDVIVVGVGGNSARFPVLLRHIINHPVQVDSTALGPGESDIRIVDRDGTVTMLRLRPTPALPPPDEDE